MSMRAFAAVTSLALFGCSAGVDDETADDSALTGDETAGSLAAGAVLVTTANVNFRSAPKITNNVIRVLPRGTTVTAVGGAAQNGFHAVTYQGRSGFISAQYLKRTGASSGDGGIFVGDGAANGFRVTYIGDSHSDFEGSGGSFGILGAKVNDRLTAQGASVALFAASSSAPNWWFDETSEQAATWGYTQTVASPPRRTCTRGSKTGTCVPKLNAILSERPSLFVIEQGSNLLGRSSADISNQVRTMLREIEGKADSCLWLGAPTASTSQYSEDTQEQLWQLISQNAAPTCYVYDSRFVPRTDGSGAPVMDAQGNLVMDVPLPYGGSDGIHFSSPGATKWAAGVGTMIDWIRTRSNR
jgi:hypothetical protein